MGGLARPSPLPRRSGDSGAWRQPPEQGRVGSKRPPLCQAKATKPLLVVIDGGSRGSGKRPHGVLARRGGGGSSTADSPRPGP